VGSFGAKFVACDEIYDLLAGRSSAGRATFEQMRVADLLVLDDLRLAYTGYVQIEYVERLHFLLQYRQQNNKPTIVTVNKLGQASDFTPNAVTQFLGLENAVDVPVRFGKYRFVHMTNEALRPEPEWEI
jgi:hypothetical protein